MSCWDPNITFILSVTHSSAPAPKHRQLWDLPHRFVASLHLLQVRWHIHRIILPEVKSLNSYTVVLINISHCFAGAVSGRDTSHLTSRQWRGCPNPPAVWSCVCRPPSAFPSCPGSMFRCPISSAFPLLS